MIDGGLHHHALRGEPEAVVDELRIARHQLVLEVSNFTIETDRLDGTMSAHHDRSAGRLVSAAALHSNEAVLDDVETADAVVAAETVQLGEHLSWRHRLAVDGNDVARFVGELDVGRRVGSGLWRDRPAPHLFWRFGVGIFERTTLKADVQEVRVHREWRLLASLHLDWNLVFGGIGHERLARTEFPFAPWCHDLDVGLQRIRAELEAHLIVALSSRSVADRVGVLFDGDFDETLRDEWTGDRGTE